MDARQLPRHSSGNPRLQAIGRKSLAGTWMRSRPIRRRRERPQRETPEIISNAASLVRGLGRRVGDGDPEHLALLRQRVRAALRDAEEMAVIGLRANNYSDGMIAEALGISRQAVEKRWPRL